ncbi:MAG: hypothetical protein BGO55_08165 [Sphingobacteriales bacterium 50-39]|nr:superinfection immunity protein [Sphingobacteriales bacterium]OJW53210.1 MAG: hypothetical protein BGO55_08165 [Sphingobacteriales bacterium 50-39]
MHPTFLFFFFGLASWILFVLLVPYFLPTIIAILRQKTNTGSIFALNFFLGWSLIGWVVALIWALSSDNLRNQTVIVNNMPPPPTGSAPTYDYKGVQLQRKTPGTGSYTGTHQADAGQPDKYEQLRKLKQLLDEGVLTKEEFDKQKSKLLG